MTDAAAIHDGGGNDSAAAPRRTKAPHLYEIDVLRILTFACVIAVHTISNTIAADDLPLFGFLALVHFTREAFFALTAFVLVYSYLNRPQPMKRFLPRRFLLVGIPYLTWSVIYSIARDVRTPQGTLGDMLLRLGTDILTGNAWYHLYFLLVTMQVYLLIPVILWLIRVTRRHHVLLVVVSGVVQVVLTGLYMYWPSPIKWLSDNSTELFVSYQFFIITGAVVADHSAVFLAWVRGHRRRICVIVLSTGVATLAVFVINLVAGESPTKAGDPLQPIEMVWSIGVVLGFLAIGTYWADRRTAGSVFARALDTGSDRSFGIFLSHPLFIWLLLWVGGGLQAVIPRPWLTLIVYVLVIVLALGLTTLARRSWFSLALTGRRHSPRRPMPSRGVTRETTPAR